MAVSKTLKNFLSEFDKGDWSRLIEKLSEFAIRTVECIAQQDETLKKRLLSCSEELLTFLELIKLEKDNSQSYLSNRHYIVLAYDKPFEKLILKEDHSALTDSLTDLAKLSTREKKFLSNFITHSNNNALDTSKNSSYNLHSSTERSVNINSIIGMLKRKIAPSQEFLDLKIPIMEETVYEINEGNSFHSNNIVRDSVTINSLGDENYDKSDDQLEIFEEVAHNDSIQLLLSTPRKNGQLSILTSFTNENAQLTGNRNTSNKNKSQSRVIKNTIFERRRSSGNEDSYLHLYLKKKNYSSEMLKLSLSHSSVALIK